MTKQNIMKTPKTVQDFSKEWLQYILEQWLNKEGKLEEKSVEILEFKASKNNLQVTKGL